MKKIIFLLAIFAGQHALASKGDWTGPGCEKTSEFDLEKTPTKFKNVKIGKIDNVEVWKVYKNLKSERKWNVQNTLLEASGNCLNLEFRR